MLCWDSRDLESPVPSTDKPISLQSSLVGTFQVFVVSAQYWNMTLICKKAYNSRVNSWRPYIVEILMTAAQNNKYMAAPAVLFCL